MRATHPTFSSYLKRLLIAVGVVLAVVPISGAHAASDDKASYVVTLHDWVDNTAEVVEDLSNRSGFVTQYEYAHALQGFAAVLDPVQLERVAGDARVAFVERDATFKATTLTATASGETTPLGVRRIGAATLLSTHAESTTNVAVLDTGIDLANGDLLARDGVNCIKSGAAAQDDNGHGTNVAGIIGARNQGAGVIGVAPGTRLYSVKVLNSRGTGTLSQILCGIDWLTANASSLNIRVANMSVAASGSDDGNCGATKGDAQHKAICRSVSAGISYVASAGNAKKDFATTVPAAYAQVLTATAMTDTDGTAGGLGKAPSCKKGEADDRYAAYSNFAVGTTAAAHTIAAPGTCVSSTKLGGGTSTYYGTSQAAPHVAGTVALCYGSGDTAGPCAQLDPAAVIARIRDDANARATSTNGFLGDPTRPLSGKYFGPLVAADAY